MAIASVVFDIRAGVAKLNQDFARAEKRVDAGMQRIGSIMRKAAVGLAAYMGTRALGSLASGVVQLGDELDKMSQRFGVSAEALQAFQYGAQQSGASVNNLQRGLKNLSERIGEVSSGIDRYAAQYERFGVSLLDANGHARASEDVLMDIADVLASMPDGAAKTEAAMKLVGVEAGPRLIPFLNQGSEGLRKFREEAESMGIVLSSDTVQALSNVSTNLSRLQSLSRGWGQSIMAGMAQPLEALTERLFELGAGAEKYARIQQFTSSAMEAAAGYIDFLIHGLRLLVEGVLSAIPGVGGLGDAIEKTRQFMVKFDVATHTVAATLKTVSSIGQVVGLVFTVVGQALAGVALAAFNAVQGKFREAFQALDHSGQDMIASTQATFRSLVDTWKKGSEETFEEAKNSNLALSAALERVKNRGDGASRSLRSFPPAAKGASIAAKAAAQDMERLARALRDNALETEIIVAESMGQTVQVMRLRLEQQIVAIRDMLERGELTEEDFRRRREALERQTERQITEHLRQEQQTRAELRRQALEQAALEKERAQQVGLSIGESITQGFKSAFEADSFRDVIRSVLGIFSRVASLMPGGQLAGGVSSIFAGLFADGGLVRGPGGDRTDNLIGLLSPGEFVNTAETVRRFGAAFFDRLNEGVIDLSVVPRYAAGGIVGQPAPAPVVAASPGQAPTVYIQAFDPRSTVEALAEIWEPAQYKRGMSRQDSKTIAMMRRRLAAPRAGR